MWGGWVVQNITWVEVELGYDNFKLNWNNFISLFPFMIPYIMFDKVWLASEMKFTLVTFERTCLIMGFHVTFDVLFVVSHHKSTNCTLSWIVVPMDCFMIFQVTFRFEQFLTKWAHEWTASMYPFLVFIQIFFSFHFCGTNFTNVLVTTCLHMLDSFMPG